MLWKTDICSHQSKPCFKFVLTGAMSRSGSVQEKIEYYEAIGRREQEKTEASSRRQSRPRRRSISRSEERDESEREQSPTTTNTTTDEEDMNLSDMDEDSMTSDKEEPKKEARRQEPQEKEESSDSERSEPSTSTGIRSRKQRSRSPLSSRGTGRKESGRKIRSRGRSQERGRAGRIITRKRPRVRRATMRATTRSDRRSRARGRMTMKKGANQLNLMAQVKRIKQEVEPNIRITGQCVEVINSLALDVMEKIAETAHMLALRTKKNSVTLRDVETATWMCLPSGWSKEVLKETISAMN